MRDCPGETRTSPGDRYRSRRWRNPGCSAWIRRIWVRSSVLLPCPRENLCGDSRGREESAQPPWEGVPQIARGPFLHDIVLALMAMKSKKKLPKKKSAPTKSKAAKSVKLARRGKPAHAAGTDPTRVAAILAKLDEAYGNATCELKHENAFQLLISTILSAQCTDVRVNQVAETLYKKYPDPKAFAYATPSELEQDIRPTGFFRNKTKSVMGASKAIIERFN